MYLHNILLIQESPVAKYKSANQKSQVLKKLGSLNPNPESVADPLFATSDFFDARDLIQVKYEMVRRVQVDGQTVSQSAKAFGLSRPSFYQAQESLNYGGLSALVPQKPGPRRSHKLDTAVMEFIGKHQLKDPSLNAAQLAEEVLKRFGRKVHPRSIERALSRSEKKRS